jgi:nitrogen regulatory protein PII 2
MKEITAIIRRDKLPDTKAALAEIGMPAMSIQSVEGRGKQRGDRACTLQDMDQDGAACNATHVKLMPTPSTYALDHTLPKVALFIPKRLLTIIVSDADAPAVIKAIIDANKTGQHGDGKVFVSTIDDARTIRTGDVGAEAVA